MPFGRMAYKHRVAVVYMAAIFMELLDSTIVNVALPTLGRELGGSTSTVEWVVIGYLLALAVVIPASGWLGDRFGTRRIFITAVTIFTLSSILCGRANGLTELVLFRIMQGVGGGILSPVGTAMLFRAFPPSERAKASAILFIPAAVAPALGPLLGGFLVTNWSWRWIFYINVPIGVAIAVFAYVALEEHREPSPGRIDPLGMVLSASGFSSVLFAVSKGPSLGWKSATVLLTGFGGLALLAAMVVVELRIAEPLVDLRLIGNRMFRTANIIVACGAAGMVGFTYLVPLYLQNLRGLSAQQSGMVSAFQAIGILAVVQLIGRRLYHRYGPRRLVLTGMALSTMVVSGMLLVTTGTNLWVLRLIVLMRGATFPLAMIPMQTAAYASIAPADTGRASALFLTQRQMSGAAGVAVVATVLASGTNHYVARAASDAASQTAAKMAGFHTAFAACAVLSIIAMCLGLMIHDDDAAATRVPTGQASH